MISGPEEWYASFFFCTAETSSDDGNLKNDKDPKDWKGCSSGCWVQPGWRCERGLPCGEFLFLFLHFCFCVVLQISLVIYFLFVLSTWGPSGLSFDQDSTKRYSFDLERLDWTDVALRKLSKQSYTVQPWIAGLATDGNELTPSVTADIKGLPGMHGI